MERKRQREDPKVRRSQILAAAKKSFRLHGLQMTTVDAIAAEAGVSVGLLYRYFRSKPDLIEAIVVEDVEVQLEQVELALQDHSVRQGDLTQLMTVRLAETSGERERLALMFEIAAEICRNPKLRDFILKKRAELRSELVSRLGTQGIGADRARLLLDRLDTLSAVATGLGVHGLIYSDAISDIPLALKRVAESLGSPSE